MLDVPVFVPPADQSRDPTYFSVPLSCLGWELRNTRSNGSLGRTREHTNNRGICQIGN
ncbi:hypothetical protein VMCG_04297 [Cytospora schulzeri]|uniref:Uncharacterized protein n=1 Tax=Cytospora schulzeri TaxID=448051 RepID=A0A423WSP1_9PEZI|nr:hypothetical protein VMCG_04297 [Valsa malicola]